MDVDSPLHVTKSFLPPLEEYVARLQTVWESGQLTNNGALVQQFEASLRKRLNVDHVIALSNGDAGLRIALRALEVTGEVITTPFSYVSTASSILWSGLTPVFCDIEPDTLTIDPEGIVAAITPRTTAILATHVFGNACDVEQIETIAAEHQLKVIYDAAHAFDVDYQGRNLLTYGDISMVSLHATKLIHSCEGGFLATNNEAVFAAAEWRRRFGHQGPESFHGAGINAKMSEVHAAMGLCVMDHLPEIKAARRAATRKYVDEIQSRNLALTIPRWRTGCQPNDSYFPVLFDSENELLRAQQALKQHHIYPRRYFYPSLNTVRELGKFPAMPISEDVASRVLCLPLSSYLQADDIETLLDIIDRSLAS